MSGVTLKDLALADDQEKFTNCPGAAKLGEIVKLDTTGAVAVPRAEIPVLALSATLLEAPAAYPAAINRDNSVTKPIAIRSLDIDVYLPLIWRTSELARGC